MKDKAEEKRIQEKQGGHHWPGNADDPPAMDDTDRNTDKVIKPSRRKPEPYAKPGKMERKAAPPVTRGQILMSAALLAILAGAGFIAYEGWTAHGDAAISVHGYIAMSLGIAFSLVVGCGLMALTFWSSRHGYDR